MKDTGIWPFKLKTDIPRRVLFNQHDVGSSRKKYSSDCSLMMQHRRSQYYYHEWIYPMCETLIVHLCAEIDYRRTYEYTCMEATPTGQIS